MTTETIEHIVQQPVLRKHRTPLLFQHGAWHGAWCWQLWTDYFASLGYEVHAISLPGHGKSSCNKKHINCYTFKDYVDTLANEVEAIFPRPVVIGHSLGGAILQKYLERDRLPGAVLLAPLPATGMLAMILRFLRRHPGPALRSLFTLDFYEWVRTPELARDMFLDPDTGIDVAAFQKRLVRETMNAPELLFPFARANPAPSPVLVVAGEKDAFFTLDEERKTARKLDAKLVVIDGQAHDLMLESAWKQAADVIDDWITQEVDAFVK